MGKTDPKDGAPHDVDEAWAFSQSAASSGDRQAFDTSQGSLRSALNEVFYLASYKYLDTAGDPVKRAEGESFYLAIAPIVKKAAPDAVTA